METLTGEEKVAVKCQGPGLALAEYPDLVVMNIAPYLLEKLEISEQEGMMNIPVTHIFPAVLAGRGVGSLPYSIPFEVLTDNPGLVEELRMETLRLGDIVLIQDFDSTHGYAFHKGSVTVGVVSACDSPAAGAGPAVTVLMSSRKPMIRPVISSGANIARYLKIGRFREHVQEEKNG